MRLVIASMKGGTGKSTVAFNLAVWLSYRLDSPLQLYDLDPQSTLNDVCELREEFEYEPSLQCHTTLSKQSMDAEAYAIFDTSFSNPKALHAALRKADLTLLPVGPSQADVWSAQRYLQLIGKNSDMPIKAFINRADTHHAIKESDQAAEALHQLEGIEVLDVRLYQRTAYRRSLSEGLGVFELQPRSKASREIEALASQLFPEFVE